VTEPSGPSREGKASHYEAAGSSPTSSVNAVYDDRAISAGAVARDGESVVGDGKVGDNESVAGESVAGDDETAGETAGAIVAKASEPARRPRSRRSRSARQRRSWRIAFFALAMTGVVALGVWALYGSRLLVVRSVTVSGTQLVPRSAVLAAAGVDPGTPLIEVNAGQVASRIDAIRQVSSTRVSRSWPDRLVIVVRERIPAVAVTAPGGGFDLVDADGVIVRWAGRRPASLPLYSLTVPVTSLRGSPDLSSAAAVLAALPAHLGHSVQSVTAPTPDQVTLQLSGGITVVWGGADRMAAKAQELTALMRTHSSYYDVSAQGVLVTK
jgi:cell division protein FtsQ